jgi:hypothetical protein
VSAEKRSADERLVDQIALVETLADYARASADRDLARCRLVRLARRLTESWELTDEEALRIAGGEALAAIRAAEGGPPQEKTP